MVSTNDRNQIIDLIFFLFLQFSFCRRKNVILNVKIIKTKKNTQPDKEEQIFTACLII